VAPLLPDVPVAIAHASSSTDTGPDFINYDLAVLDAGLTGNGAFNTASPRVLSKQFLRVSLTLNPSADKSKAPRLAHWKVQYDCVLSN
jgi:hypothetical protein